MSYLGKEMGGSHTLLHLQMWGPVAAAASWQFETSNSDVGGEDELF